MSGHLEQDKIGGECIQEKVRIAPFEEKMVEFRLKEFGRVGRRPTEAQPSKKKLIRWIIVQ